MSVPAPPKNPPPVPNVLQVVLNYLIGTDITNITRLYLEYAGNPPSSTALNQYCTDIGTQWGVVMAPIHGATVTLNQVNVADLTSSNSGFGQAVMSHVGTRTGGALPGGTALLVNYKVNRRYRGGKPRSYLPAGVVTDVQNPQTWLPAFVSTAGTAWNTFLQHITSVISPAGVTSMKQVNVSLYEGFHTFVDSSGRSHSIPTYRDVAQVDDILGALVNPNFGSQRRRNR